MVLQWVLLELWLDHQQTLGEVAPLVKMATVTASLAAQDPQPTPDGAALVALVVGKHQQAPCWATLVTLVAPVAALLAALGLQLTPDGVAFACRLGRRPRRGLKHQL